jgi:hypothetical protein
MLSNGQRRQSSRRLLKCSHCIKTESYIAQKCVNIHSGPDSKVMHSFTTSMCFSQSSVIMMDTSPVHRIWHAKARYARFLTLPTARVIHVPPAQQTGLSLASWTRPSFAICEGGGGGASGRQLTRNKELIHCTLYKYG